MPGQDPNLPPGAPGTAEGPFSRYLTAPLEGKVADDTAREPRPSGYMGTGGKLAMLGANLLRGLQQGKMAAYANREQEKITQYAKDGKLVDAVEADPDIPKEVKTKARMLLGQSWTTATKEQIAEIRKFHGKKGTGFFSHILGGIEHVADTLGGPTPTEHTLGGKDASGAPAREKLMELLAGIHQGGSQYSMKGRYDDTSKELGEYLKGNHDKFKTFEDIVKDSTARGHIEKLGEIDPKRARTSIGLLQEGYRRKTKEDIRDESLQELRDKLKSGDAEPVPAAAAGQSPVAAPTAGAPAGAQPVPSGSPSPQVEFNSYEIPGLGKVKNPEHEKAALQYIQQFGGKEKDVKYKQTLRDPNGNPAGVRVIAASKYPEFGNIVIDDEGRRIDPQNKDLEVLDAQNREHMIQVKKNLGGGKFEISLQDVSQGPVVSEEIREPTRTWRDVNGRRISYAEDPMTRQPIAGTEIDQGPAPREGGGGAGSEYRELRDEMLRMQLKLAEGKLDEQGKKHAVSGLVDKIMSDIHRDAKKHELPPEHILDQRLADFEKWYGSDPRFEGNFESVRDELLKRKQTGLRVRTQEAGATKAEASSKITESKVPKPKGPVKAPVPIQKPPGQSVPIAAPATPTQGMRKLTDKAKVKEYLQKAGGDVDAARALAKADKWEF